jgi:hypothetical protein
MEIADPGATGGDNVRVATYDVGQIEATFDRWHELSRADRRRVLRSDAIDPIAEQTTHNDTTPFLWRQLAALMNPRNDPAEAFDPPDKIAFSSESGPFDYGTQELPNIVGRVPLDDPTNFDNEFRTSELVGALELEGANLRSVAIETEGGKHWNLTPLPAQYEPKTSAIALVIEMVIPVEGVQ